MTKLNRGRKTKATDGFIFCPSERLETFFVESFGNHGFRHPVILETGKKTLSGKQKSRKNGFIFLLSQRAFGVGLGNVFMPNHLGINGTAIPVILETG